MESSFCFINCWVINDWYLMISFQKHHWAALSEKVRNRSTHHQSLLSGKACFSSSKFKNISVAMMTTILLLMTVRTARIWSRKDQKLWRSNKKFLSLPKSQNVLFAVSRFLHFWWHCPPLLCLFSIKRLFKISDKVQKIPFLRKPLLATRKWVFGSAEERNFVKLMKMFVENWIK